MSSPRVGILALQGAVSPHTEKLKPLGVEVVPVRHASDLNLISGIILPGGESTTMLHLLHLNNLWQPLGHFVTKHPTWGLCAGAILLARNVKNPTQPSLGVIDIEIKRNAYGRQQDSFVSLVNPTSHWKDSNKQEAVFIRAPRMTRVGSECEVLFEYEGEAVAVRQNNVVAMTYHPELSSSDIFHRYFIEMIHG